MVATLLSILYLIVSNSFMICLLSPYSFLCQYAGAILLVDSFVFVAFVTDVFSLYIVGWRVMKTMKTDLVLHALEQAMWARGKPKGVIHHSDRGSQYLSIRYSERLMDTSFNVSVGSVADSYDNAMAESINSL